MVEIPADVARRGAEILRATRPEVVSALTFADFQHLADLLDPQPPTLREQVAKAWCADYYGEDSGSAKNPSPEQAAAADAVIAVVADWLAAQPLATRELSDFRREQRDHDVRLLRGES